MSHGPIVVGGSIAYDNIVRFPGRFEDSILSEQVGSLNVSFLVDSMKRIQGGTGANIAYNLSLVGEKPILMGTAGKDFAEYRLWLHSHGVDTRLTRVVQDDFTATCTIITDLGHNQITSFYPGAMDRDQEISLHEVPLEGVSMVVIAPTEPGAMIRWAVECQELGLPFLFDPGMQIPRLSCEDLSSGIRGASILVLNEYEYLMMQNKTGLTREKILRQVGTLVVTLGVRGSVIARGSEEEVIPAARPNVLVNPTGVGDAFRAGLLKGYLEGRPLSVMGRMGSVSAVYAVEHQGATEHHYTLEDFRQRYAENFDPADLEEDPSVKSMKSNRRPRPTLRSLPS